MTSTSALAHTARPTADTSMTAAPWDSPTMTVRLGDGRLVAPEDAADLALQRLLDRAAG